MTMAAAERFFRNRGPQVGVADVGRAAGLQGTNSLGELTCAASGHGALHLAGSRYAINVSSGGSAGRNAAGLTRSLIQSRPRHGRAPRFLEWVEPPATI